ncbi:ATP-dependent permease [Cryptococcus bacillisporus CA1873]|uniref:ATP-dependent permease n=1 Tax=Cryptococcus bacillisporus CA1873 TaxID=1296111 RepID=A0ABR5B446_CRYGA|nr:ATP-dependent permease [Cryptococcus bacillisporus CA1873]|eukprot:KIR58353.1 ATP-dependent permease [Cryptococcus gattii CA1873]
MIRRLWLPPLCLSLSLLATEAFAASQGILDLRDMTVPGSLLRTVPPRRRPTDPSRPPEYPPCFNCLLPAFNCGNSGECNPYDGQCKCPPGFGGQDCLTPLCGALSDGDERFPRPKGELCECKDGWGGINCNHRKIIDTIPDNKPPQVTFSCLADSPSSNSSLTPNPNFFSAFDDPLAGGDRDAFGTCNFQFWVDRIESFHCELSGCNWESKGSFDTNQTSYQCEKIECACIPGRFLCGEDGSVNIDDFLNEEVKGPGSFSCATGRGCSFSEPAMNQLINDIFGDKSITLDCESGECLHYTQVPGYITPEKPDNRSLVALSAAGAAVIFILACILFWYFGRTHRHPSGFGSIHLPSDEASKLMSDHVPATLHFNNLSYTLPSGKRVLSHITGTVRPGELLAIMGASGAGKSTLLDILARKSKSGKVRGDTYLNSRPITDGSTFRRVIGYVDQEDTLLPTLTVYETVLFSALLRLPREMSYDAKVYRTLETMNELGILGIKDARIGESGKRSISGGEKRRVSIACELVTGPSVLFLDEPTSGLDSYNAQNVIQSLHTLAQRYKRTVIFTIHQPQSNIVNLFDRLLLLAKGQMVYSGEAAKVKSHFEGIGYQCPEGWNTADWLIDLTVDAAGDHRSSRSGHPHGNGNGNGDMNGGAGTGRIYTERNGHDGNTLDPEAGFPTTASHSPSSLDADDNFSDRVGPARSPAAAGVLGEWKAKAHSLLGALIPASSIPSSSSPTPIGSTTPSPRDISTSTAKVVDHIPEKLASLVLASKASDDAKIVEAEISRIQHGETADGGYPHPTTTTISASASADASIMADQRDVEEETGLMKGYQKAGLWEQFKLLSSRTFKNLYRNPLLMATHYAVAIIAALLCGFFFYQVTNDIPGFQNRLGLFLFILSLFAFSCLSSLGIFANERLLFMRERANGYYSPITYFLAKLLFDIIPLRVIPPFILGSIVYGLAGLNAEVSAFWKFIMTLVLFNLTASSIVLFLSVAISDLGVANLLGSLIMLYNLLFAGLLMNYDRVPKSLKWMLTTSFFHAGYEALLVNELRYLQLVERKFGLDIQVPSATMLSYLVLEFWVKERR